MLLSDEMRARIAELKEEVHSFGSYSDIFRDGQVYALTDLLDVVKEHEEREKV